MNAVRLPTLLAAVALLTGATVWADKIPAPRSPVVPIPVQPIPVEPAKPAPVGTKAQLVIEARDDVNESILVIPASLAGKPAENKNANQPGAAAPAQPGGLRLAMAGLALSGALGFGGLWLARRGGAASMTAKLAVAGAVLVGVGGTLAAWADVGPRPRPVPAPRPPPQPIPVQPVPVPAAVTLSGPVIVQIDPQATEVKLIVNRKMLAKLAGEGGKIPVAPPPPGNNGGLIPVAPPPVAPQPAPVPVPAPAIRPG